MKQVFVAGVSMLATLFFVGCATVQRESVPVQESPPPEVDDSADSANAAEPVLTIDETYDAISLSVRSGDPEAAIAAYQEAKLEDPDDPSTELLLANLYLIAGVLDEADSLLEDVLKDDPRNTEALFTRSLTAAARGDSEAQRSALLRILELDPANAPALASLGEIYLEEGDLQNAQEKFASALAQDGTDIVARMGLGNVLLRQEKYTAAEEQFTSVIGQNADYPLAYSDRARARSFQRRFGDAAADLTRAIELEPDYRWNYIDRGRIYLQQGKYADAVADFDAALARDSSFFLGYALRGRAYDALDERAAALEDYSRALELRADYTPVYAPYATMLFLSGRPADAAEYFRKAFLVDPRRLDFALLTALSLKAGGQRSAAIDWINEHLSQFPRDTLYYQMARYYLSPGNEGNMLAQINQEQDDVVKGQMYFYLAAQLELLDRRETARAAFLEAEDTLPPGVLERRLASQYLEFYRSGQEGE